MQENSHTAKNPNDFRTLHSKVSVIAEVSSHYVKCYIVTCKNLLTCYSQGNTFCIVINWYSNSRVPHGQSQSFGIVKLAVIVCRNNII